MFKTVCGIVLVLFAFVPCSAAVEIAGVDMPDTLRVGEETLLLNGAGIRTKIMMNMYVAGLYLVKKNHDAESIISADEPMAIRLQIVSKLISSSKMVSATEEGFERSTGGNTAPIQHEIDSFIKVFKNGIQKNDVYDLVYIPGKGVEASKNGKLVATIPGIDFKKAMFGIWLCKNPSHNCPALKDGMLGQ
jgi:hypothetical protein